MNPTPEEFTAVAPDLGLTDAQTKSVTSQLQSAEIPIAKMACFAAQLVLSEEQVDTPPIDEALVNENWSKACVATPACIIKPRNAEDVALALKIVNLFQLKFSTRSGGHSPNPGWSSIDGRGVLIDLGRLNGVSVARKAGCAPVVSVGSGARWGEVYEALDGQQASVIGGRNPDLGVGGLILGGGYYHVSPTFGLAADNVKNFEVVTAAGAIINANASQNSDLFWALKGGGPNFGIVTRFDINTINIDQIWGQINVYAPAQALEVLDAFGEWQENGASDSKANIAISIGLDAITVGLIYAEPSTRPSSFDPFYHLTPLMTALPPSNLTFAQISQLVGASQPNTPGRHDYRAFSSHVNTAATKQAYSYWLEKATSVRVSTGAVQTFSLQHVGPTLVKYGADRGGNPLNLPTGTHQWWTTLIEWQDAADDEVVRSVSIETTKKWASLAADAGSQIPFLYLNDASRDQNPLASYGSTNLAKLKEIAMKYDPQQVFQKLQNGGFLLSRA